VRRAGFEPVRGRETAPRGLEGYKSKQGGGKGKKKKRFFSRRAVANYEERIMSNVHT